MEHRREAVVAAFAPDKLTAFRTDRELSVSALARRAGIHRQNLGFIESGKRSAGFATIVALAEALEINPLELTVLDPDELSVSGLRLSRSLSRSELAERCDMSYDLLWAIETGRRPLTDDRAQQVADELSVDVDELRDALQRELDILERERP